MAETYWTDNDAVIGAIQTGSVEGNRLGPSLPLVAPSLLLSVQSQRPWRKFRHAP